MDSFPEAPSLRPVDRTHVEWRGRRLIYFGGCDYFRLSWHPAVRRAAKRAIDEWGLDAAASRITTGNLALYRELERSLARFFCAGSAVLTTSGYTAPIVAAQALAGRFTHALMDEAAHGCLKDAAGLLDCPVTRFRHDDLESLAAAVKHCGRAAKILALTDGLSSFDGSVRPLDRYLAALPSDALLLVDDAHGAGVLGRHGRGSTELLGLDRDRLVLTVTLSKAFGCYGGAVLGPRWLRGLVVARSRLFAGNTPLPPPLAAAALAAVGLVRDGDALRRQLATNTAFVRTALTGADADTMQRPGPTFSLVPKSVSAQERLRRRLLAAGIYPPLIRYQNGPAEHFFRFAISSGHTRAQLATLRAVLAESQ